jgi:hypothetical protein
MNGNYKYLQNSVYLVRTQAGLKQAIKDWMGGSSCDYSQEDQEHIGSRFTYPAIVDISTGYRGCTFIRCNWVHVNVMKEFVKDV